MLLEDEAASLHESETHASPWVPALNAYAVVAVDPAVDDPSRNRVPDRPVDKVLRSQDCLSTEQHREDGELLEHIVTHYVRYW